MKKLLLSLAMAVGICSFVMAQEQSKALTLNNTVKADSPATEAPVTISVDGTDTGSTATQLRMKSGNKMTVSVSDGYEITKIDFGCTYVDYNLTSENVSTTPQSTITNPSNKTATVTLSAPASSIVLTIGGNIRFQKATVYYQQSVAEGEVPAPIISCDCNFVTITGKTGVDFYYTLDESTPTTSSKKYDKPFAITADVTVKAIAVENGKSSDPTTYNAKYETPYDGFRAFMETTPSTSALGLIEGPITAIYQNGKNIYVRDSKGAYMLLFNRSGKFSVTSENGTQFAYVKGSYSPYNSLPEFQNVTFGAKTEGGAALEPTTVTIADLSVDNANEYVKLEGINITEATKNNVWTGTDKDGKTIEIYNTFNSASNYDVLEVPTGIGFTITGFVCRSGETLQITPVKFEGGTVVEPVADPVFSVASGEVAMGTVVKITCATEGANIFYTTDGGVPDATSTPYTADGITINKDARINAIAIKEGMLDSEVVSVEYTVLPEGTLIGTFNFGEPTTLTPAVEKPANGQATDVYGKEFTANGVTFSVASEGGTDASTTKPCLRTSSAASTKGEADFRIYDGWSFTVTAPAKHALTKIVMNHYDSSNSIGLKASAGSVTTGGVWTMPTEVTVAEDAATAPNSVTFTAEAKTFIQTMNVYYVSVSGQNGIEDVIMGDEDAPVEYYNLQGVRVMNPTAGLYIVKQGSKVSKAIIR